LKHDKLKIEYVPRKQVDYCRDKKCAIEKVGECEQNNRVER